MIIGARREFGRTGDRRRPGERVFPAQSALAIVGTQKTAYEAASAAISVAQLSMRTRFITLVDEAGIPIGPPVQVTLSEPTYDPSRAEWEAAAIRIAIQDGLIRAERRREIRARFED